jgi:hypothetical protein
MISVTSAQQAIIDSGYKQASWLFEVAQGSYYWSTKEKSYGGQDYSFKVIADSFRGVREQRGRIEYSVPRFVEANFDVSNKDNSLTDSDFEGETITIKAVVGNGSNEEIIRTWKLRAKRCEAREQRLEFNCVDFVQEKLEGDYPNTPLLSHLAPSKDLMPNDNMCVPVVFGTAYIPTRSIYKTDQRYYFLGPSGVTYTVSEVRSPIEWPTKSIWQSNSYTFTVSSQTLAGSSYQVLQPIIADSNNDGTPDASGLWPGGDQFHDMPTKFSRSDTSALTSPEELIENVLEDIGIPSADIDTGGGSSFEIAANSFYADWGLTLNGGFFHKIPRSHQIAGGGVIIEYVSFYPENHGQGGIACPSKDLPKDHHQCGYYPPQRNQPDKFQAFHDRAKTV